MGTNDIISLYDKYVIPNYTRNPVVLVKGKGVHIWDSNGKCYLDLFSGWAVSGLGHCHHRVSKAIQAQVKTLVHAPNIFYTEPQGRLAQLISENSFGGQCFFCNSGAEANEAAIKLVRIHYSSLTASNAQVGQGKYKIITMLDSFHGRTLATVTATAQPKYHKGFSPLVEGFTYVPFNDLAAVEKAIDEKTGGIMIEPIQGEGGVNVASQEYLKGLRKLCDKNGILLILDEVQTGMGRTGKFFAYQHYGIEPDILTLAKALGNGTAVGAIEAKKEIAKSLVPGSHASTFGGNPLACSAAIAVFETISKEGLLERATKLGDYALKRLKGLAAEFDIIREIRGIGLMIGIELKTNASDIVKRCMESGLLLNCTHDNVIRFYPPLIATRKHIDEGIAILRKVLT